MQEETPSWSRWYGNTKNPTDKRQRKSEEKNETERQQRPARTRLRYQLTHLKTIQSGGKTGVKGTDGRKHNREAIRVKPQEPSGKIRSGYSYKQKKIEKVAKYDICVRCCCRSPKHRNPLVIPTRNTTLNTMCGLAKTSACLLKTPSQGGMVRRVSAWSTMFGAGWRGSG